MIGLKARPPNDHAVNLLKDLLAQAERGEILSVVVIAESAGCQLDTWHSIDRDMDGLRIIGALEHAKFMLLSGGT